MKLMMKELKNSYQHTRPSRGESISCAGLKAQMSDDLAFCGLTDTDGSIEQRLSSAGLDHFSLFQTNFLPREEVAVLGLNAGIITRLYLNVQDFAEKLREDITDE